MKKMQAFQVLVLLGSGCAPGLAWGDLYSAAKAYESKDFERSFQLYRELAELGQREAQENLAAMYVGGEGIKRDNVLGYAWAAIAKENGSVAVQGIIDQLDAHLNDSARARIAEVQAQFGMAALQKTLLPSPFVPPAVPTPPGDRCGMKSVADPASYYPAAAKRAMISGSVLMEVTVGVDGRARNPRVWYSLPANEFDDAGRQVAMKNVYTPKRVNGVPTPCTIRFKVKFGIRESGSDAGIGDLKKKFADTRASAEAGDPRAQLLYGLMLEMRPELKGETEIILPWYVKAAQAGIPSAQYLVGRSAMAGSGFERDEIKGAAWLKRAASAGQAEAMVALSSYLLRVKPQADSFAEALGWLEKAAAADNLEAVYYLSALLAAGPDTTRRDPKRALELSDRIMPVIAYDPVAFEIRAAAQAMLGDFEAAQKSEKSAMQKARGLGWDTAEQEMRLASYAASKPWTGDLILFTN